MKLQIYRLVAVLAITVGGLGLGPVVADAKSVRVALLHHQRHVFFTADGGLIIRAADAHPIVSLPTAEVGTALAVRAEGGGIFVGDNTIGAEKLTVSPLLDQPLAVDGRAYRGSFVVQRDGDNTLSVVNVVDIEQYLYSVVAGEMNASWPAAALQAQAVVARSFALSRLGSHDEFGFDLHAGEQDQMYQGAEHETASTTNAVQATRGLVLSYGDRIVHAYYSACDGGRTSDGSALNDPQPYLKVVDDPYAGSSPNFRWTAELPLDSFSAALRQRFGAVGTVRAIEAGRADPSGRLEWVNVVGTTGVKTIPAKALRLLGGTHVVKSTRISLIAIDGAVVRIAGAGFGHGVGLSQWGARQMAKSGFGVEDILRFYYRGAALARINDPPAAASNGVGSRKRRHGE